MKTSKIEKINGSKEWGEGDRKTTYYSLEMENGDKINIGKKKVLAIGEELNYEITDTSQEYNKAKSVNPEFQNQPQSSKPSSDMDVGKSIIYQVAFKESCAYYHGILGITSADESAASTINGYALELAKGMIANIKEL